MKNNRIERTVQWQNAIEYLISALAIGLTAVLFIFMANRHAQSSSDLAAVRDASAPRQERRYENSGQEDQVFMAKRSEKRAAWTMAP